MKNIVKTFGKVMANNNVNFSVEKGEVVSIVGASGAGKTTLLQILGTLSRPDGGTLEIDGKNVLAMDEKRLAAFRCRKIGFVFQAHHLLPEFSPEAYSCFAVLTPAGSEPESALCEGFQATKLGTYYAAYTTFDLWLLERS